MSDPTIDSISDRVITFKHDRYDNHYFMSQMPWAYLVGHLDCHAGIAKKPAPSLGPFVKLLNPGQPGIRQEYLA